ncbi:LysR family transcriptional regulator [Dongshaea marina]|uniref:LysR family transcriptional regulator n=1 Tax=Dongshaea marina TaxID=2047966 RepID=UPI000D3E84C3|nr:LysR family transcriptional regulator [Dongshaea marina]
MQSVESLHYFIAVVKWGGFSAAANQLNCATSTVSRHVQQLEEELKTPLFIRHTRKLALTEEGQLVYDRGLDICSQLEDLENSLAYRHQEIRGMVRISAPHWFTANLIAPLLPELHQKWPQLKIYINHGDEYRDPFLAEHDIYFCVARPVDSSLIMRPVSYPEFWLCASPEYLKSAPGLNSPDDLKQHSLLGLERNKQLVDWFFNSADGEHRVSIDTSHAWFACNSYTARYQACLNHGGVALIPKAMAQEAVRAGLLRRLLVNFQCSTMDEQNALYIVYTKESSRRPRVKAVIDELMQSLHS